MILAGSSIPESQGPPLDPFLPWDNGRHVITNNFVETRKPVTIAKAEACSVITAGFEASLSLSYLYEMNDNKK